MFSEIDKKFSMMFVWKKVYQSNTITAKILLLGLNGPLFGADKQYKKLFGMEKAHCYKHNTTFLGKKYMKLHDICQIQNLSLEALLPTVFYTTRYRDIPYWESPTYFQVPYKGHLIYSTFSLNLNTPGGGHIWVYFVVKTHISFLMLLLLNYWESQIKYI